MRRMMFALLAMFALVLTVAAPKSLGAQSMNMIRVMHASPDAPAVDIYVSGQRVLADVPFFSYSGYLSLPDGTYQIAITPAGASTDDAVLVGDLTVEGGYIGTLAAVNALDSIEAILYDDDISPMAVGTSRVRIIHASPDAPTVDIKVAGTSTVVVGDVSFPQYATLNGVPAGTYAFDISPAGSEDVAFTTPDLRFEQGWTYTLVATGLFDEGGFWVQSRVDNIAEPLAAAGFGKGTGKFVQR
jgi:hypothetical protein